MRTNETTRPACRNTAVSDSRVIPAKSRQNTEQFPVIPSDSHSDSRDPGKPNEVIPTRGVCCQQAAPPRESLGSPAGNHSAANIPKRSLTNDLERAHNAPKTNAPRTFAPSERAQEQPRWRVHKQSGRWLVTHTISPDRYEIVTPFLTHAAAISAADSAARIEAFMKQARS